MTKKRMRRAVSDNVNEDVKDLIEIPKLDLDQVLPIYDKLMVANSQLVSMERDFERRKQLLLSQIAEDERTFVTLVQALAQRLDVPSQGWTFDRTSTAFKNITAQPK